MKLVSISRETLPQFLERIGGKAPIESIASRYGWSINAARREMRTAAAAGIIVMLSDDEVGTVGPLLQRNRRRNDWKI